MYLAGNFDKHIRFVRPWKLGIVEMLYFISLMDVAVVSVGVISELSTLFTFSRL